MLSHLADEGNTGSAIKSESDGAKGSRHCYLR